MLGGDPETVLRGARTQRLLGAAHSAILPLVETQTLQQSAPQSLLLLHSTQYSRLHSASLTTTALRRASPTPLARASTTTHSATAAPRRAWSVCRPAPVPTLLRYAAQAPSPPRIRSWPTASVSPSLPGPSAHISTTPLSLPPHCTLHTALHPLVCCSSQGTGSRCVLHLLRPAPTQPFLRLLPSWSPTLPRCCACRFAAHLGIPCTHFWLTGPTPAPFDPNQRLQHDSYSPCRHLHAAYPAQRGSAALFLSESSRRSLVQVRLAQAHLSFSMRPRPSLFVSLFVPDPMLYNITGLRAAPFMLAGGHQTN